MEGWDKGTKSVVGEILLLSTRAGPRPRDGEAWRQRLKEEYRALIAYHQVAPEIELPTLDGKIHMTYRGGKICLMGHFKPLWAKNCPRFGLAHAPWLAAEVPILVDSGMVKHKDDEAPQQSLLPRSNESRRIQGSAVVHTLQQQWKDLVCTNEVQ